MGPMRLKKIRAVAGWVAAAALVLAACGSPDEGGGSGAARGRALPGTLYGVTLDDVSEPGPLVDSLKALPKRPMARIVFDRGEGPGDYEEAVRRIHGAGYVLGQPVDSYEVSRYGRDGYRKRFERYVGGLGRQVDLWEVGNELNGEWLGRSRDVVAKTEAAYDVVRRAGGRTALTLYYNPECWEKADHAMLRWARENLSERLRHGLDYVFVSYYEHDCEGHRPSAREWEGVFRQVHALFPGARLGFGEVGTREGATVAAKEEYLRHYYRLSPAVDGWVGGWFWWYYAEDMVPYRGNRLWNALRDEWRRGRT